MFIANFLITFVSDFLHTKIYDLVGSEDGIIAVKLHIFFSTISSTTDIVTCQADVNQLSPDILIEGTSQHVTITASDVNKDLRLKAKDLDSKAKDLDPKAKDLSPKAKAKASDSRCQREISNRSFHIIFNVHVL